jgi:hypothetical protein
MKISLIKSGGISGLIGSIKIDTDTDLLSEKEVTQIKEYLNNINFFDFPAEFPFKRTGAADYFTYEITVEDINNKKTVIANDISMPPKLKNLIAFIESKHEYVY